MHLPVKDFRAYKIGTNIQKGMEFPEGAARSVYEMNFVYKVNGKEQNFGEKDLMSLPEGAEFVRREDKLISQGYVPPIHDFTMEKDGSDYKEELLNEPKFAEDLEKNWAVVAEAIQTILRRENYPNPYEALKDLTRTNQEINKQSIHDFIDGLQVSDAIKNELKVITPSNYLGI